MIFVHRLVVGTLDSFGCSTETWKEDRSIDENYSFSPACMSQQGGWYKRSWLGWAANNSLTDLHPVVPEAYKRVVVQPLLHLTPALRTLHLDAKRGRDSALADNMPIGRNNSPSPASEDGAACQPDDEAHGINNGNVQSSGNYYSRWEIDSRCETNHTIGAVGERRRGAKRGGCENILEAQWTEWQRTMCLIPDVGSRMVSQ